MRAPNHVTDLRVFMFIEEFIDKHYFPPSQREIADGLGISVSTINRSLWRLHDSGRIEILAGNKARAMRVIGARMEAITEQL